MWQSSDIWGDINEPKLQKLLINSWNRVILEKPIVTKLLKNFPKCYGSQRFITGCAVAQRLDVGFPPRLPGFAYGQHVGFVVDKAALGRSLMSFYNVYLKQSALLAVFNEIQVNDLRLYAVYL
jgi:hypothetical protein